MLLAANTAQAQTITTFAGNGTGGYSMDNIAAVGSELNHPFGIAFSNSSGSLYITDRTNNRIRKVSSAGIISTVAGNGVSGFTGDGGPATAAEIADPVDVAVDGSGNIYIADKSNNRIRKVDVAGNISTVAGIATSGFSGDNGPATNAQLATPRGVAADSHGNIYISDQGNNRIRKVDNTGIITTIAGNAVTGYNGDGIAATDAQLKGPYGIAVDGTGNIYLCDVDNERIRKIDNSGIITTVAGTGTGGYNGDGIAATAAQLSEPIGVAVDGSGNVFIADGWNARIRAVGNTGLIYTIAGNGTAGFSGDGGAAVFAQLNDPYGVAVDGSGNVYIADYTNNRIRSMTKPTKVNSIGGTTKEMKIYPNPSSGAFKVELASGVDESMHIIVSDVWGRMLKDMHGTTNKPVDVQLAAADGLFFISVSTVNEVWNSEVLIAR
jgi:sugar lactone lactonase YvrE